jgi:hypothetical protein
VVWETRYKIRTFKKLYGGDGGKKGTGEKIVVENKRKIDDTEID